MIKPIIVWEDARYLAPIIEEHFGEDGPSKMVVTLPLTKKTIITTQMVNLVVNVVMKRTTLRTGETEKRMCLL